MAQGSRSPPREAELLDDDGLVDIALTDLKVELQAGRGGGGKPRRQVGEIARRTAFQGPQSGVWVPSRMQGLDKKRADLVSQPVLLVRYRSTRYEACPDPALDPGLDLSVGSRVGSN